MFMAIAQHYHMDVNAEDKHEEARAFVMAGFLKNPDLCNYIEDDEDRLRYIARMAVAGDCEGGEAELRSAAEQYGRDIIVHDSRRPEPLVYSPLSGGSGLPAWHLFFTEKPTEDGGYVGHYEAVVPKR